jgi:hypothetical protein
MKTIIEQELVLEYMDIVYFGYDWSEESVENLKDQSDFMKQLKERFPNVAFKDAYDNIKGYRQEVFLEEKEKDNYFAWLFGKQWYNLSLICQLMLKSATYQPEQKEKIDRYLSLAKKQYPEAFKPEALV